MEPTGAASRSEVVAGVVRTSLGDNRGSDEARGEGGEPDRDPEIMKVEIGRVHGIRESEHGGEDPRVSRVLTQCGEEESRQSGQGARWGG